ncbi:MULTISPECIES: efflux RND transporter periplasmic adaptor subunit [Pelotomaculum]|uniref:efflux RND transporter periplasmic adaptor subunit n=1 Tax=Pelotomaculum TaxID=191373 RepID=UPI00167D8095|nr:MULTISPECIES: efflux RND transporter periplasmic adaptor subunit [Pelotomaculum]
MKRLTVLVLALLLCSLFSGCGKKQPLSNEESSTAVEVVQVSKTDMNKIYNTSGQIEASSEATIASKVSGRVAGVNVKLGDRVEKGQVLFTIESREASHNLAESEADLGIKQVGYDTAQVSYDTAAQALNDAQVNYDRISTLYESGAVSKTDLEDANTKLVNARLSLEQARLSLEQTKQEIDKLHVTISTAQDNLEEYTVTAPISGYIGEIDVDLGEMVSSSKDVASIVSIDTVKVEASIPESVVNNINLGNKVPVTVDSLNKSVEGTVTAIAPKADSTTMGYPVEITVANPDGEIKPGMTVKINLVTGTLQNVIAVPVDAVIDKDGQHIVYIVEDSKAKEVYVETGVSNDSQVEITKGLEVGQSIVVEGNRLLSDGQQVKVVTKQEGDSK